MDNLMKILLIENDPAESAKIREALLEAGADWFELREVKYATQAIRAVREAKADIVLLDFSNQENQGVEAFQRLREAAVRTPILILSHLYDTRTAIKFFRRGAQDFLVKGQIRGVAFRRALRRAIERQLAITEWEQIQLSRQAELEKLATTDELTGLYNRRYLRDHLLQEMFRAERYGSPLSVLMLDLDYFKQVNDSHGHELGDDVLVCVAGLIKHQVRANDIAGRYGGEEFCIILTETDALGATTFAERLRACVEAELFRAAEGQTFNVTCSIGGAQFDRTMVDTVGFIKRADKALYEAKQAGRNRVRFHKVEVESYHEITNV